VLFAFALPRPALANASIFINSSVCPSSYCKAASIFGVLAGPSDALKFSNSDNIFNDVGLSAGATLTTAGTVNIGDATHADVVDFSSSLTNGNSSVPCQGPSNTGTGCHVSTFTGNTKVWGGTQSNPTLVNDAYTQFTNIATYWQNQSGNATDLTTNNPSGNWNIQSTLHSNNTYIFNAKFGFTPGSLVIGCGAQGNATDVTGACKDDLIVIIVPTGQTASILNSITFAPNSGLSDDQLLFLIESNSGTALSLNGSGSGNRIDIHGDFFVAGGGGYTVGNGKTTTIDGRVFAGGDTTQDTLTWNAGVTLDDEGEVPEPETWALMAGGLLGIVWIHRRYHKTRA